MKARNWRANGLCVLATLLLTAAATASAQDDRYRETARLGVAAFNDGEHATAIEHFEQARAIRATPRIDRLLGRAQLAAGLHLEAARSFGRALRNEDPDFPLSDAMRQEITDVLLPEALAAVGQLELSGLPEGAEVRVDGEALEPEAGTWLVEPGAHTVSAPGFVPDEQTVEVEAGASAALRFEPAPAAPVLAAVPPPEPPPSENGLLLPGIALMAGGLAIAGAGAALLAVGWDAAARVQAADFYPDVASDDDLARWMTPTGIAALAAGGALAAVGVVLMVLPADSDAAAALRLGPGQLTLAGRFR